MTILEENHHSFLIVEHDPLLYEDAEKRMVEYMAQALKQSVSILHPSGGFFAIAPTMLTKKKMDSTS
jgi:hypothetical protein